MAVLILMISFPCRACSLSVAGLAQRVIAFRASIVHNDSDPFWLSMPMYALA